MSPAEEWDVLAARFRDLIAKASRKSLEFAEKAREGAGWPLGEAAMVLGLQRDLDKVIEDTRAFMLRQIDEAREKPQPQRATR